MFLILTSTFNTLIISTHDGGLNETKRLRKKGWGKSGYRYKVWFTRILFKRLGKTKDIVQFIKRHRHPCQNGSLSMLDKRLALKVQHFPFVHVWRSVVLFFFFCTERVMRFNSTGLTLKYLHVRPPFLKGRIILSETSKWKPLVRNISIGITTK